MAIVTQFRKVAKGRVGRAKRTDCGYARVELDGVEYLLLESYGSSERSSPGKISQSLHIDRSHAAELRRLLARRFPGICPSRIMRRRLGPSDTAARCGGPKAAAAHCS